MFRGLKTYDTHMPQMMIKNGFSDPLIVFYHQQQG